MSTHQDRQAARELRVARLEDITRQAAQDAYHDPPSALRSIALSLSALVGLNAEDERKSLDEDSAYTIALEEDLERARQRPADLVIADLLAEARPGVELAVIRTVLIRYGYSETEVGLEPGEEPSGHR